MMRLLLMVVATLITAGEGSSVTCELPSDTRPVSSLLQVGGAVQKSMPSRRSIEESLQHARFIIDEVRQGKQVPDNLIMIVRFFVPLFANMSSELVSEMKSDQGLLNQHAADLAACDDLLLKSDALDLHANTMTLEGDLRSRQAELQNATAQQVTASTELVDFLNRATPPSSEMPMPKLPGPAMDAWVSQDLAWYIDFNNSYATMEASLVAAQQELDQSTSASQMATAKFQAAFCRWKTAVTQTKAEYDQCRKSSMDLYESTRNESLANNDRRKDHFTHLEEVKCLLNVLVSNSTHLEACTSTVVNTAEVETAEPALPPYNSALVEGLGVPDASVQCQFSLYSLA